MKSIEFRSYVNKLKHIALITIMIATNQAFHLFCISILFPDRDDRNDSIQNKEKAFRNVTELRGLFKTVFTFIYFKLNLIKFFILMLLKLSYKSLLNIFIHESIIFYLSRVALR